MFPTLRESNRLYEWDELSGTSVSLVLYHLSAFTAASGLGVGDTLGESEGGAAVGGPVGETVPAASPATLSTTSLSPTPTLSPRCESQEITPT